MVSGKKIILTCMALASFLACSNSVDIKNLNLALEDYKDVDAIEINPTFWLNLDDDKVGDQGKVNSIFLQKNDRLERKYIQPITTDDNAYYDTEVFTYLGHNKFKHSQFSTQTGTEEILYTNLSLDKLTNKQFSTIYNNNHKHTPISDINKDDDDDSNNTFSKLFSFIFCCS